jgi:site-specific DNA-methyltransferase (adenine-specific)
MQATVLQGDCLELLSAAALAQAGLEQEVALTFFDPPFNQGKEYAHYDDNLPQERYWEWIVRVCAGIHSVTAPGGALYFMQREKNAEHVLRCLRATGWTLQNLIIWTKHTSAVPGRYRYGKQYQIIAFATKGPRPRVFNRLRIDPPRRPEHKYDRKNGLYLTDVWDDIRELTAGYFAGDEALRQTEGGRLHDQQSPIALLARIILSSTHPGDVVLDPAAGTGTTLAAAEQLGRPSVGIDIDPDNIALIRSRLQNTRPADALEKLRRYYCYTANLDSLWPII